MDTNANPAEEVKTPEVGSENNPEAGSQDPNPAEPPKDPKSEPSTSEAAPENGANPQEQKHDWQKRYTDTSQSLKEKSEQYERAINSQAQIVQNNPDYLEDLAKTDKAMADEVTKKVYGQDFETYKASQKIKDMREIDPEAANREERLLNLERMAREQQRAARETFLAEKGIKNNKFDPDHQKLVEQMELLNPNFVETNYARALEIAHSIAFPERYSKEDMAKGMQDAALSAQTTPGGGGGVSTDSMPAAPKMNSEAKSFNQSFKSLVEE